MENINEHDMTKKMLDAIRNGNTPNSLNENVQNVQNNNNHQQLDEHDMTKKMLSKINEGQAPPSTNTDDTVKVDDDDISEEASKLNGLVGRTNLKLYEVYPKDGNVVMVGVLNNGIEFKFSFTEGAPYINVDNSRLDSETVDIIKKLQAYYDGWVEDWTQKIDEYTQ